MSTSRVFKNLQSLGLLSWVLLLLTLAGCAQNPVSGNYDFVMLSEDHEISIGRTNHPKIIAQYGRYQDEALQAYVQSIGKHIAATSHRKELIYHFTVLDSPVVNAFALPGGYIYITRGLMAHLNSEAELAAVLGHEIGHVTARHGVRQQSASGVKDMINFAIASILFPELPATPSQQLFDILGGALLSGYGREHELEADELGAEYLARSGYDPKAMLSVIRALKDQETFAAAEAKKYGRERPGGYHGLFASHPDNDTRLHEMIAAAEQYVGMQKGHLKRDIYLDQIDGLTFGYGEKHGVLRSGRYFYHLGTRSALVFPEHWQVSSNPSGRLRAVSTGGKAIIEVNSTDINRKLSPFEFIKQRLKISKLKSGRTLNVNDLKGYTGLFDVQGKPARISVIYLRDKAFIFFAQVKDEATLSQFDDYFLDTVSSFHLLREDELSLAREMKMNIISVGEQDNYTAWSKKSNSTNHLLLQLRLLNGHYPDGQLLLGQRAKYIQ